MLHTKFCGNWPAGSGEDFLKGFYHIWAWQHLGHETSIISTNFNFHVPKSLHTKFGKNGPVVSEKSMF